MNALADRFEQQHPKSRESWITACDDWRRRYPLMLSEYYVDRDRVSGYVFMDELSDALDSSDTIVVGNGLDAVAHFQVYRVKEGQRTLSSGNWGSMGWDLPMAIGASVGSSRRTVCVAGDGSVQLNVQELATIRHYSLPVKIFVFNNDGFGTIRATQRNLMEGRLFGSSAPTGADNPDFRQLAGAYGFGYQRIANPSEVSDGIRLTLEQDGPTVCEVLVAIDEEILPKASAFKREDGSLESRPLEDMAPFLPREEVRRNMHLFDDDNEGLE